ncbi:DUF397 domain-containing protein [Streptomyces zhihengii]
MVQVELQRQRWGQLPPTRLRTARVGPQRPPGAEPTVHIRDSKTPTGPVLTLTPTAWASFVDHLV